MQWRYFAGFSTMVVFTGFRTFDFQCCFAYIVGCDHMVYLSVFIRMVSGYECEKLYAVFPWKSMDRIEKHTKSKCREGVCQKLAVFLNWLDSKNVVYENAIMYENFCMNSYLAVCGTKRFYHYSRRWDICIAADVGSILHGLSQM